MRFRSVVQRAERRRGDPTYACMVSCEKAMVTLDDRTAHVLRQLLVRASHEATPRHEAENDIQMALQLVTQSMDRAVSKPVPGSAMERRMRVRREVVEQLRGITGALYRAEKKSRHPNGARLSKLTRLGPQYRRALDELESKTALGSMAELLDEATATLLELVADSKMMSTAVAAAAARLRRV